MIRTKHLPSAISALAFAAVFLGVVFGTTLICEDKDVPGLILLIVALTIIALLLIWAVRTRRMDPEA